MRLTDHEKTLLMEAKIERESLQRKLMKALSVSELAIESLRCCTHSTQF